MFYALSSWLLGVAAGPDTMINPDKLVAAGFASGGGPDPTTVRIVPWATDPTAQVLHDCYDSDGKLIPFALHRGPKLFKGEVEILHGRRVHRQSAEAAAYELRSKLPVLHLHLVIDRGVKWISPD